MKYTFCVLAILVGPTLSVHAQERPRYFENFDTRTGVQVQSPANLAGSSIARGSENRARTAPRHYLPSPETGEKFKKLVAAGTPPTAPLVHKTVRSTPNFDNSRNAHFSTESRQISMKVGTHLRGFSTGDPIVDGYIVDSSRRYGIDPLLIFAQMGQESAFKKKALSHKGASGLMQLMPATARRLGVTDIYDPRQNIEGGVKYMRMLLDLFSGDVRLALAGYNAGEGAVMKYGYQIPPYRETRDYVIRISERYNAISGGREVSKADYSARSPAIEDFRRPLSTRVTTPSRLMNPLAAGQ